MRGLRISLALIGSILPSILWAYETQLTPAALHEAYVLGQRNDKATGDFLDAYASPVTESQDGPHIAQIQLLTPFAQIVDLSRLRASSGYTEEQAANDYKDHGKTVRVNITIMLPAAFPKPPEPSPDAPPPATGTQKSAIRPENFWQNFKFSLSQNGKTVPSKKINNKPIYSAPTNNAPAVLDGESVWLEYDVNDVAPAATTVEVTTPEGKSIKAEFDLKKLR
jgi:hypothetical protein